MQIFKRLALPSTILLAAFVVGAAQPKFVDWLDTQLDGDLSQSVELAKQHDGIHTLAADMPDLMLFLPINSAWKDHGKWIEVFKKDPDLRYDMILACGAEAKNTSENPVESLRTHQQKYGMLDSGYGTPYFVMSGNKVLCLGAWNWQEHSYVADTQNCANLQESIKLKDATVFKIDKLLLPAELVETLEMVA